MEAEGMGWEMRYTKKQVVERLTMAVPMVYASTMM